MKLKDGDMEEDPSYKQLISYCLLENEKNEILVYKRLSGGGSHVYMVNLLSV